MVDVGCWLKPSVFWTWFPFTWLCMAPRDNSLHKHMHFCTHSNPYFGNYNNHLPIYHTLTFYKVQDNMQEVLAYKSDDNMGLGGIFHNMCMVLVSVLVLFLVLVLVLVFLLVLLLVFFFLVFFLVFPSEAAWSQRTWQFDLLCSIFFSWSFQDSNPPQWLSLCFPSCHMSGSGFLLFVN